MDTLIICLTQYLMKRADDNARFNSTLKDLKNELMMNQKMSLICQSKTRSTNIKSSQDEMNVIDSFLFRCWQMGWLDKYK